MMKLSLIGNLGADARLENSNGGDFVAFNVAHTETIKKADGTKLERTTWVSCTINGRNEGLFPYLKKGTRVFVWGDPTFRTFHSEKQRMLAVGVNLFVRSLELVGGNPDLVPRFLFTEDGLQTNVSKYFWSENSEKKPRQLFAQNGSPFIQDANGFISPVATEQASLNSQGEDNDGATPNQESYFGESNDTSEGNLSRNTGSEQHNGADADKNQKPKAQTKK